ncbi:hypothetical protein AB0M46_23605 [Dactylosporangium sp. NPDC051485]|uniref:hypothetical protein n=1 Tax=Dactylosporangium sp. NPDC051485 TaxID=3154846 RepID=UPI003414BF39
MAMFVPLLFDLSPDSVFVDANAFVAASNWPTCSASTLSAAFADALDRPNLTPAVATLRRYDGGNERGCCAGSWPLGGRQGWGGGALPVMRNALWVVGVSGVRRRRGTRIVRPGRVVECGHGSKVGGE